MSGWIYGLAIGFAAGSLPFAWWLHAVVSGRDLRDVGSGNPGSTNLGRSLGGGFAGAALLLDAGKGAAAVFVAQRMVGPTGAVPAAVGAVVGHVFSPWLSGRGGKGVATAAGAYAVLAPAATGLALTVFVFVVSLTRFVSLGSVLAALSLPVGVAVLGPKGAIATAAAATAVLIAWRHRENFARMRAGTEPRVGRRTQR